MAKAHSSDAVSAFECDVIRQAFRRWVAEDDVPEEQWRPRASRLVRIMTGTETVDPEIVDWIIRK